jgi:GNAT superfamily N-acetyltransferase
MATGADERRDIEGVHIVALSEHHAVAQFDSGAGPLDTYLKRFALANQIAGTAQTFVACVNDCVIGYYGLSGASIDPAETPANLRDDLAPVMLLACLAVDRRWQGKGVGATLLHDALRRTRAAADTLGLRALMVHAKDRAARRFYEHFGFMPSPVGPFHLLLPLEHAARSPDLKPTG